MVLVLQGKGLGERDTAGSNLYRQGSGFSCEYNIQRRRSVGSENVGLKLHGEEANVGV